MLGAQFIKTAMVLLFKLALNDGMPPFVLITYRSLIGAAVVAPMAVICEREMFKKTNLVALGWICISATMGYG
ncbi:hypothetical protein BRADI_3g10411v3 [Brachypodium distachyon]|uniref:WAT1-related protein n=1 Tax=Brachypodium distachyon TaxID=15368 RepID=A0A2K2CWF1_BRADI|nr:hypothetical protein BRADI_3g10411v3 [Brachypodium distachyon]